MRASLRSLHLQHKRENKIMTSNKKMSRRQWGQSVLAIGSQLGLTSVGLPMRALSMGVPSAATLGMLMTEDAYAAQSDEHVSNLVVGTG